MANTDFERMDQVDQPLYGPTGLLASGFSAAVQSKLRALLTRVGMEALSVVWVHRDLAHRTLADLLSEPDGTGAGVDSDLPRALVVGGITQGDLHRLMAAARQSGMQSAIWAAVTSTSAQWPFAGLLEALAAERAALSQQSEAPPESSGPSPGSGPAHGAAN